MRTIPLIVVPLAVALAACRPDPEPAGDPPEPVAQTALPATAESVSRAEGASGEGAPVMLSESGNYLVDASGLAVYALEGNPAGSKCDATCEGAWPPVLSHVQVEDAAAGLQPGLLSSEPRNDGAAHVTYANQRLYRYAGDAGVGTTSGAGVEDQWGTWYLVSSAGTLLETPPAATGDAAAPGDPASN